MSGGCQNSTGQQPPRACAPARLKPACATVISTTLTTEYVSRSKVSTTACSAGGSGGALVTARVASARLGRAAAMVTGSPRAAEEGSKLAGVEAAAASTAEEEGVRRALVRGPTETGTQLHNAWEEERTSELAPRQERLLRCGRLSRSCARWHRRTARYSRHATPAVHRPACLRDGCP